MNDCRHGFVVRDIQGDQRFLCRECDKRFPHYPKKGDSAQTMSLEFKWNMISDMLKESYERNFVGRMNKPGFVSSMGVTMGSTVSYNLPIESKITETVTFLPNRDLGKIDD